MLELATIGDESKIIEFCETKALGVRIASYILSYGFKFDFSTYWIEKLDDEIVSVVAKFENTMTICASENTDFSQLKEFIYIIGFDSLQTQISTAEKLGFINFETKQMLVFQNDTKTDEKLKTNFEDYKKLYNLISKSIPNSFENSKSAYNFWLSDFTFKKSRNLARAVVKLENENLISCVITASESSSEALMSGVACDENFRGKGIGKSTVYAMLNTLAELGKKPYIIALNDGVEEFYHKIGFEDCYKIAYVSCET